MTVFETYQNASNKVYCMNCVEASCQFLTQASANECVCCMSSSTPGKTTVLCWTVNFYNRPARRATQDPILSSFCHRVEKCPKVFYEGGRVTSTAQYCAGPAKLCAFCELTLCELTSWRTKCVQGSGGGFKCSRVQVWPRWDIICTWAWTTYFWCAVPCCGYCGDRLTCLVNMVVLTCQCTWVQVWPRWDTICTWAWTTSAEI